MKKYILIISGALIISAAALALKLPRHSSDSGAAAEQSAAPTHAAASGVESITLSSSELTIYADSDERMRLTAEVFPENASVREITWKTYNSSIVFVDRDGYLQPNGVGKARVRAESSDGSAHAECEVTVKTMTERGGEPDITYTDYDITLYDWTMDQMAALPSDDEMEILTAHDEEVEAFANPENFMAGHSLYQFLVLNESNGVDAQTLDIYLSGKGILSGCGSMLKKAAEDSGVSEAFLTVLACLSSECGTNELVRGAEYEGEVVYNPLGITDPNTDNCIQFAYEQSWFTLEEAVIGGAKWLGDEYFNNERYNQNTLYKMRWNLESPVSHQYSKEVDWADSMAVSLGPMLEAFPEAEYHFDVPILKKGKAVAG